MTTKRSKIGITILLTAALICSGGTIQGKQVKSAEKPRITVVGRLAMKVGDVSFFSVQNKPKGKKVTWRSSSSAATVLKDGTVIAKRAGNAKITAKVGQNILTRKVRIKKGCKKDPQEVASLQKIIISQRGDLIESLEEKGRMKWDKNGHLIKIEWWARGLEGKIPYGDFKYLRKLDIGYTGQSSIDLSKNTELRELVCNMAQIKKLDLSANTKLKSLICWGNNLKSLDLSKNTQLTNLACGYTKISKLDLSHNYKLKSLDCGNSKLKMLDLSHNPALKRLSCMNNKIKSLNLRNNKRLNKKNVSCDPKVTIKWSK